ncbi:MAG: hypothetical protein H6918_05090 [Sphingomonadaceae bacterium]|nr:hypothetical protein [Sphingomonadaceae bacterium]
MTRGIAQSVGAGITAVWASVLMLAAPAQASEIPDLSICDGFPVHSESEDVTAQREQPLVLPADWTGIAAVSPYWIAVSTEYHTTYCVSTQWMLDADNFERFDKRFLGFHWEGPDAFGYILIDRSGQGYAIDTSVRPHFTPEGTMFAVLNRTDTGMEEFDGFAIWSIHGGALRPYLVNFGPPLSPMIDWRIEDWEGENCLHISAVPYEQIVGNWEQLPNAPRSSYIAHPGNQWQIAEGKTCPTID